MSRIIASVLGAWSTPVALDCDCSPQEAIGRLKATLGSEAWLWPNPGLAGRFDPDSLWLWLAPRGRNSFQAYFRGRLVHSRARGCRLEGEVLLSRWAVALAAFMLVVSVLFFTAAVEAIIDQVRAPGSVASDLWVVLVVASAFLVALLLFISAGFRSHAQGRDRLVSFLKRTLGDVPQ